ncbi:hypothetical protein [Myxococcus landrumensis]|uniref:Lipoprotein n=1 Tax=Myxococcus landrumensis TaxID=2813577 RepID=A0ABX7N979_9BACT|nr:hypothetical protein [Myxococcus landrumus]QSQ15332.1 hypothetical protein JY572_04400 [Myxococcus landrumus]
MKQPKKWFISIAVSILVGCGATSQETPSNEVGTSSEELVEQTVIWVNNRGELEQTTRFVTKTEEQIQFATRQAKRQAALNGKSASQIPQLIIDCNNDNSLWLYDRPNYLGRKLCLYRNPNESFGLRELGKVVRYIDWEWGWTAYWAGAVRSLSSGSDGGNLSQCEVEPPRVRCFTAPAPYVGFGPWTNVSNIAASNSPNTAWLSDLLPLDQIQTDSP